MSGKAPPRHASQQLLALLAPIDVGLGLARDFSWRITAPDISPTWPSATLSRTFIISIPVFGQSSLSRRRMRRRDRASTSSSQTTHPTRPVPRTHNTPIPIAAACRKHAQHNIVTLFPWQPQVYARAWLLTLSVPKCQHRLLGIRRGRPDLLARAQVRQQGRHGRLVHGPPRTARVHLEVVFEIRRVVGFQIFEFRRHSWVGEEKGAAAAERRL